MPTRLSRDKQRQAHLKVHRAIQDCGRPAHDYYHRDYASPLLSVRLDTQTYLLLKLQADKLYRTLSGHIRALAETETRRRDWRTSALRKARRNGHA